MKIIRTIPKMMQWRKTVKPSHSVGFVPTMGALHQGHLSLVNKSRRETDLTVASIFVNPTQFGVHEDLKAYPRPFHQDISLLKKSGVDILFAPTSSGMYPPPFHTLVQVTELEDVLCGSPTSRGPSHFRGVATVVAKLFNIVRPTQAYFGRKDFQQWKLIEQMNRDLNMGVKIIGCPIVREKDGLALSSRNLYLSPKDRQNAPYFYRALQYGRKLLRSKTMMSAIDIRKAIRRQLSNIPGSRVDYVEIVDPVTLKSISSRKRPALLVAALWIHKTRLIDNILVK